MGQAVQAMERLSAAVERSSSELDEFRAAQRQMQEQTLQVLTEIRNNTCNASSSSTAFVQATLPCAGAGAGASESDPASERSTVSTRSGGAGC